MKVVTEIGNTFCPDKRKLFKVDKYNLHVITSLIYYFMGDKQFENEEGKSLNKGILLRGTVGTGKSVLMKIFNRKGELDFTKERSFNIISCIDVYSDFIENGIETTKKHTQFSPMEYVEIPQKFSKCFDELGEDNSVSKHYGNTVNVMEMVIMKRYYNFQDHGLITHFTTNLTPEQIEQHYGERVRSRLAEMCNDFIIEGPDRRKK